MNNNQMLDMIHHVQSVYNERVGWYHNIDHIVYMIKQYVNYSYMVDNSQLHRAILFHDIVYNIPKPGEKLEISNEELSASYYMNYTIANDLEYDFQVGEMIRATEHHFDGRTYTDDNINKLLDLDVHGFANPDFEDFLNTQKKIDFEYTSNGHDPEEVKKGRLKFLSDIFENKKLIYRIVPDKEELTERAYSNIERLLKEYNV